MFSLGVKPRGVDLDQITVYVLSVLEADVVDGDSVIVDTSRPDTHSYAQ